MTCSDSSRGRETKSDELEDTVKQAVKALRSTSARTIRSSEWSGHPGRWKTLELVTRNYWWPHMSRYIGQYTATCDLCLWTKVLRQPPTSHLRAALNS